MLLFYALYFALADQINIDLFGDSGEQDQQDGGADVLTKDFGYVRILLYCNDDK